MRPHCNCVLKIMTGKSRLVKLWLQIGHPLHIKIFSDSAILKTWQKNIDLIMLIIPNNQCYESKHWIPSKKIGLLLARRIFRQLSYRRSYLPKTSERGQKKKKQLCVNESYAQNYGLSFEKKTVVTQRNHYCIGLHKFYIQKKQSDEVLAQKPNPSIYKIGTKKIT